MLSIGRTQRRTTHGLLVVALLVALVGAVATVVTSPAPAAASALTSISAGLFHTCAIKADDTLACWGNNGSGRATPPDGTFTQVSAGWYHTCAITTAGTLACWGSNADGQLDNIPSGTFTQVSAGLLHTCAITTAGTVDCWGGNSDGQTDAPSGTFIQVSAGGLHTCAITTAGTLDCWGNNFDGRASPPSGTFTQVSAGGLHTCAITTAGTLDCWGRFNEGQTRHPSGTFTQVSAGEFHSCAIETNGSLDCWGDNVNGQAKPPSGTFAQVSAGGSHTCAIKSDGSPICWGGNSSEELGADVQITSAPPPNLGSGPFSFTYTATGSPAPTFALTSGGFPPNLTLNPDGTLSGTPTTEGTYSGTVTASNGVFADDSQDFSMTVDFNAPTTTASATVSGNPYAFGDWTNQSVTVTLDGDDGTGLGVASTTYTVDRGPQQTYTTGTPIVITAEGMHTLTYWSVDAVNNVETAQEKTINIDLTNPTITFAGNHGTYTVDQAVSISCVADDALSGVASTTCQDITGPATSFAPGLNSFSAQATDNAGNVGSGSTSFTIAVTVDGLRGLTEQYANNSRTARSLTEPLGLVDLAERMHNPGLKAYAINSYIRLVNTQRGRGLSNTEVATLIRLAQAL